MNQSILPPAIVTQSAGVIEYIDCISAEEWDPTPKSVLEYDIKQFKGVATGNEEYPFIAIVPKSGSTR